MASNFWSQRQLTVVVAGPHGVTRTTVNKPFARIGAHASSDVRLKGGGIPLRCYYLHVTGSDVHWVRLWPLDDADSQKRVVGTEKTISREKLTRHVATSGSTGESPAAERKGSFDQELPIPDYDELSVRGAKVRLDALSPDELRRLRTYEEQNKMRKTLIHEIDRRLR